VRRTPGKQLVAVTPHDDVAPWLLPDWTLRTDTMSFAWNEPAQRPPLSVEVVRVHASAWQWFAPHHYLTATLNPSARCFLGIVEGRPAVFAAILPQPHHTLKNAWRFSRVVVLPDNERTNRGYSSVSLLLIDEASRTGDDLYRAMRPVLAMNNGRLVAGSTPFGKRGWFFEEFENLNSRQEWHRIRVTAEMCPRYSAEFLAYEREAQGERWFNQEFMACFESMIDEVFSYEDIQDALSLGDSVRPLFPCGATA
jgi:hypothetical protein